MKKSQTSWMVFMIGLMTQTVPITRAAPGDLVVPLPPDYTQGRPALLPIPPGCGGLPATTPPPLPPGGVGSPGGAYCGPTAAADLLKWLDDDGYPGVGAWGNSYCQTTQGIFGVGLRMNTHPDAGTTTENLRDGLQDILDDDYPGIFDVGYIGRVSESALEQDLGRNFAWLALHLELGHLVVGHIGWYDLTTGNPGQRCGGHYVAMTGYDDDAGDLYARMRDPARDVDCAVADATGCVGRWLTDRELVNLQSPDAGCVIEPVFASKWDYVRGSKAGAGCSNSNCDERRAYQDGFAYVSGVRLFSRPATGTGTILGYNRAASQTSTHSATSGGTLTSIAVHPFTYELYHCRPGDNQIYKTDPRTNMLSTVPIGTTLNQPRRLTFGSDGMLYVLQGNTSPGFNLLAIRPDGSLAGMASQSTMGAIAYHEATKRVYWWSGPSNQLQAFTSTLTPVGSPITLPSGPAFVAPGYLAAVGTIVGPPDIYYNHDGSSLIYRFDIFTMSPLSPISGMTDPSEMAVDNRDYLYVAPGSAGQVRIFDPNGNPAGIIQPDYIATGNLAMTRAVRTPLIDAAESNPHNQNVDSLDVPQPPAVPAPPHDRAKNRYLSFATNVPAGRVFANPVGFCVEPIEFPGICHWVGPPDLNGIAGIEAQPYCTGIDCFADPCDPEAPLGFDCPIGCTCSAYRAAWPPVVHVGGCQIVPTKTYRVRAVYPGPVFSAPLPTSTITQPTGGKFWGDTVGGFGNVVAGQWDPPNGVVNVNDYVAALQGFLGLASAPHVSVTDVQAVSSTDPCLNKSTNIADVFLLIKAFQGNMYPFTTNPSTCPPCP